MNKIKQVTRYDYRNDGCFYEVEYKSGRKKLIDTDRDETIPDTVYCFLRDKQPNVYAYNPFWGCMIARFWEV